MSWFRSSLALALLAGSAAASGFKMFVAATANSNCQATCNAQGGTCSEASRDEAQRVMADAGTSAPNVFTNTLKMEVAVACGGRGEAQSGQEACAPFKVEDIFGGPPQCRYSTDSSAHTCDRSACPGERICFCEMGTETTTDSSTTSVSISSISTSSISSTGSSTTTMTFTTDSSSQSSSTSVTFITTSTSQSSSTSVTAVTTSTSQSSFTSGTSATGSMTTTSVPGTDDVSGCGRASRLAEIVMWIYASIFLTPLCH